MKNTTFGKIKRQARFWKLYVLLMEMGQTTNYPLYTAVRLKYWNVPEFCSQLHLALFFFTSNCCPASFHKEQSAGNSWPQSRQRTLGSCLHSLPGLLCPHNAPLAASAAGQKVLEVCKWRRAVPWGSV